MPWRCLPLCVDTVAKFGSQTQELNISLTAVGLMVILVYFPLYFIQLVYYSGIYRITFIKIKANFVKLYQKTLQFFLIFRAL